MVKAPRLREGTPIFYNAVPIMPIIDLTQPQTAATPYDDKAIKSSITDLKLVDATTDAALKILGNKITALETKTIPAQVIKSDGNPPDGSWLLALDVRKTADKRTTRLWGQVDQGIAKPLLLLEDTITTPTHSTAIAEPDGSFKQDLGDLKLSYKTTLNAQNEANMAMTFPAGLLSRVDLEGQDAQGTALELGGQAIGAGSTSVTLNPFMGNSQVTQILFKITFADNSVTQYLIPLTRP